MNHQINPYHNLYGAVMRFIKRQWNYLVASNSGEADFEWKSNWSLVDIVLNFTFLAQIFTNSVLGGAELVKC